MSTIGAARIPLPVQDRRTVALLPAVSVFAAHVLVGVTSGPAGLLGPLGWSGDAKPPE